MFGAFLNIAITLFGTCGFINVLSTSCSAISFGSGYLDESYKSAAF